MDYQLWSFIENATKSVRCRTGADSNSELSVTKKV